MAPRLRPWYGLSVNGVLTRTVADTALFLDVVAQNGPGEPPGAGARAEGDRVQPPALSYARAASAAPGRLRIAFSERVPAGLLARLDRDAAQALAQAVELLRSLGHDVVESDPDYGPGAVPAVLVRYLRGTYDDAHALAHPERLERRTRAMARLGGLIAPGLLARALAAEAQLARRLNGVLERHDVLITPSTAAPPPRIGALEGRGALWTLNAVAGMVPYNVVWNVTGQPAASVPLGFGSDGLPRGVQLVGRREDEATLLSLAAQIESERPWAGRRPAGFA